MQPIDNSKLNNLGRVHGSTRNVGGVFVHGIDGLQKSFEAYKGEHLTYIQSRLLQHVKPKDLEKLEQAKDIEEFFATVLTDESALSQEAKAYLKELRRRRRRRPGERDRSFLNLTEALALMAAELEEELARSELEAMPLERPDTPIPLSKPIHLVPREPRRDELVRQEREEFGRELTAEEELAHKLIAYSPNPEASLRVVKETSVFGLRPLYRLYTFGLRIIVLEESRSYHDVRLGGELLFPLGSRAAGTELTKAEGIYLQRFKVIVLRENQLGRKYKSVLQHELAHAWENTYNVKRRRDRLGISVELWNRFAKTRQGFISNYASTSPAEYFAESVEAFFRPILRKRLQEIDPEMFHWLGQNLHL